MLDVSSVTWEQLGKKKIVYNTAGNQTTINLLVTYMNASRVNRSNKDLIVDILALCDLEVIEIVAPNDTSIMFRTEPSGKYGFLQFILNSNTTIKCRVNPHGGMVYFKPFQSASSDVQGCGVFNNEVILTGGGAVYSLGYISICMSRISSYVFKDGLLSNLNSKTSPYLKDTIAVVSGPATDSRGNALKDDSTKLEAYASIEQDYISSVGNATIKAELLNQVGINKISIPRYKISENNSEYHFEGLSFPNNRKQMTEDEKIGQFCHDGEMQLSSSDQVDALYWSTTPHIYPEIICNYTDDTNTVEGPIGMATLTEDTLSIAGLGTWQLKPDDVVVYYYRGIEFTPKTNVPRTVWSYVPSNLAYLTPSCSGSITSLSLSSECNNKIKIYRLNPFSKRSITELYLEGEEQPRNHIFFSKILKTSKGSITLQIKNVSDHTYLKASLFGTPYSFTIGTYTDYTTWQKHTQINNTCAMDIDYIGTNDITVANLVGYTSDFGTSVNNQQTTSGDMSVYLGKKTVWNLSVSGWIKGGFTAKAGTLPAKIPFYSTGVETQTKTVMWMEEEIAKSEYSSGTCKYTGILYQSEGASTAETLTIDMYWYNKENLGNALRPGVAIVIWRNGKLIDIDNN